MTYKTLACLVVALAATASANAENAATHQPVSAQDVLNILIEQGVVDEAKVRELVRKAQDKTREQYQSGVETVPAAQADAPAQTEDGVVRVPYVPQYIRDEIRDKVRSDLREQVVADVLLKAEQERWGLPGTAPDWTQRIRFSGDMRVRAESIMFPTDNVELGYKDYNAINSDQQEDGIDDYLNTVEDRHRLRTRLRFGLQAKVTQGIDAGARIVTGNSSNPVSTNETLGDYGRSFDVAMDRAYMRYKSMDDGLHVSGGRFENPFMRTDLIWDNDLQFDGIATSYYWLRSSSWDDQDRQWDPFVSFGVFPVDEMELSSSDRWLVGLQSGFTYTWWNQNEIRFGVGYFHYENMPGTRNAVGDTSFNYTAPAYFQKGNSVYDILNADPSDPANVDKVLYALVYDYRIVDVLLEYSIATFSPHRITLTAEYLKNIGADDSDAEILRGVPPTETRHDGYLFKVTFGWPMVAKRDDWQVAVSYRSLRADAVVDAFADSDFHLGGTDGKGYIFEGSYGLFDNTALSLRWMSSDSIDLAPPSATDNSKTTLGVDVLQLDVSARF